MLTYILILISKYTHTHTTHTLPVCKCQIIIKKSPCFTSIQVQRIMPYLNSSSQFDEVLDVPCRVVAMLGPQLRLRTKLLLNSMEVLTRHALYRRETIVTDYM